MTSHFQLSVFLAALLLCAATAQSPQYACDTSDVRIKSLPFCNTRLPIAGRVRDLVSRLTLDEKISQLVNSAPGIPRLSIPPYEWWSEALHGVSGYGRGVSFVSGRVRGATVFPQVINSAATFDSRLWYRIGQAIGKEARAVFNEGQGKGLTFWTPNINIYRDPRWGRGHETPGEDPMVGGKYAVAYVRGLQGDTFEGGRLGNAHLQASACCKHFTAYDLDNWEAINRFGFDAKVTAQDMADTYQPPFRSCVVEGKASGIMCAYDSVNGVPNCANYNLLTTTARRQWGFNGYITSDCDAVSAIHEHHRYASLQEDAVADVLKAGLDVECGTYLRDYTKSALLQKKLQVPEIDRALRNQFSVRMRLGLFDGSPTNRLFSNLGAAQVCSQEHQQLALEGALNSIVLLKNSGKLLPLSKSRTSSLAIIGPNADYDYALRGNYDAPPCKKLSVLKAFQGYGVNALYNKGCNNVACASIDVNGAVGVARQADYVVMVMGLDQTQETEDHDRVVLTLPGQQESLIGAVAAASKRPVVLVLIGGPVDVSFAKHDPKIGGIIWAGYPGEAGGIALAKILFGEHNPGGKLPMTWYPKEFINVPMTDMRMRPDPASRYPGRTYRFYTGPKVFEFGYGLSYTTYSYKFIRSTPNMININPLITPMSLTTNSTSNTIQRISVSAMGEDTCERSKFSTHVRVKNTGLMAGKHPVLLFAKHARPGPGGAVKQLVGFESVELKGGERGVVEFVVKPCEHLSKSSESGSMMMEKGDVVLMVGNKEYPITLVL